MVQKNKDLSEVYEIVAPEPGTLIQSLRSVGYTLEAAIADLIDNSITAGAKNVWVDFVWNGANSIITVRDDGKGMTPSELVVAMRAGSQNPLLDRHAKDLGRFGLGLKTASFSQCRNLTVASKVTGSVVTTRRWDLDYVGKTSEWRLLHGAAPGSEQRIQSIETQEQGTVVLWEKIDRLIDEVDVDNQKAHKRFLKNIARVEQHLGIVFHRFLQQPRRITIYINNHSVNAWDPFMSDHVATQQLPEELLHFHNNLIKVRPYVLPHRSRLLSEEYNQGAGPKGWNAQQGFYVYRNQRLLLAGDWLGLGFQKEEYHRLARIAIYLPNSMDQNWDIDVKKSRARPPGQLQEDLLRIARITRERAQAIYRHRGKILARKTSESDIFIWNKELKNGQVCFRINRELPLITDLLQAPEEYQTKMQVLLRLIEETIPTPLIILENSIHPDSQKPPFEGDPPAEVLKVIKQVYLSFRKQGSSEEQARERLISFEPFQDFKDFIMVVDDDVVLKGEM